MLIITDRAALVSALSNTDLDSELRALLGLRAWQLHVEQGRPLGAGSRLIAVQGGDTSEVITAALGFALTLDPDGEPNYDWIDDHGLWFEIVLDPREGVHTRVFVENGPSTALQIHYLCLAHFWPDDEGDDR